MKYGAFLLPLIYALKFIPDNVICFFKEITAFNKKLPGLACPAALQNSVSAG
jgi:hypothetical protein